MGSEWMILAGALGGAFIGAVLAPLLNHSYRMKQLKEEHYKKVDYMKKELIFQSKLDYFKKIGKNLEKIQHRTSLKRKNSKKEFEENELKISQAFHELVETKENDIFLKADGLKPLLSKFLGKVNDFSECKLEDKNKMEEIKNEIGTIRAQIVVFIQKEIGII